MLLKCFVCKSTCRQNAYAHLFIDPGFKFVVLNLFSGDRMHLFIRPNYHKWQSAKMTCVSIRVIM